MSGLALDGLRWSVGIICLALGSLTLITPHRLAFASAGAVQGWVAPIGVCLVLGGAGLIFAAGYRTPGAWCLALHLPAAAGLPLLAFVGLELAPWARLTLPLLGLFVILTARVPPRLRQGRPSSLRARTAIALAAAAALPLIASFALIAGEIERAWRDEALAREQLAAARMAQSFDRYVALHLAAMVSLAERSGVLTLSQPVLTADLRAVARAYPDLIRIETFDRDGVRLAASDGSPIDATEVGAARFASIRAAGRPLVMPSWTDPRVERPVIGLSAPVIGQSGAVDGAVIGTLASEPLSTVLAEVPLPGRRSYLVDADGRVLVQTDPNIIAAGADLAGRPPVAAALATPRERDGLDYGLGQDEWLAGFARMPNIGWHVVAERPASAALADAFAERESAFWLVWAALAATSLAGLALADRLIGPLAVIARAATRLSAGDPSAELPASEVAELAELAESFRAMRSRVTAREQELRQAHHFVESVLETAPTIVYVFDLVEQRNVLLTDQAALALGRTGAELEALGPELLSTLLHPDDRERLAVHLERVAMAPAGEVLELEYRMLHADGQWRWFNSRDRVFDRDDDDRARRILGIALDVTAHRRADEALQESERRLRLATSAARIGHFEIDWNTRLRHWSPELRAMFAVPDDLDIADGGWFLQKIMSPESLASYRAKLAGSLDPRGSGEYEDEHEIVKLDGSRAWMLIRGRTYFEDSPNGPRPSQTLGLVMDVTERKAAEAERERLLRREQAAREVSEAAVRARDLFLSIAAHELKTPIAVLRGQAQLSLRRLVRGGPSPAQVARSFEIVDQHSAKLQRLVEQLLDLSRLETGRLVLEMSTVDVAALVRDATAGVRAREPRPDILVDAPPTLPASTDPLRLEQVVNNLLDNAIKYGQSDRPIELHVRRDGSDAFEVAVRDYGPGVRPEQREQIFERHHQARPADQARGFGLGLFISRQIAEQHGGSLRLESPADGGARFVLRMPVGLADFLVHPSLEVPV